LRNARPSGKVHPPQDREETWRRRKVFRLSAADDALPERLLKTPHKSGPAKVRLTAWRGNSMARAKTNERLPSVVQTAFDYSKFDVRKRLREIGMFFQKNDPVHQAMRRLAKRLERVGIPYAVMGAMAVNLHGARRTTDDVDVLVTKEGLERFRNEILPKFYKPVEGKSRRFEERKSGVRLDCLVTGHFPGRGGPKPFAFPDPAQVAVQLEKVQVVNLPQLIQLKLAAGRYYDFGDVAFLIRVHNLDESFLPQLHPSVHQDFIECLEEKRREDEYIAREG
jgi:hypothetical protein